MFRLALVLFSFFVVITYVSVRSLRFVSLILLLLDSLQFVSVICCSVSDSDIIWLTFSCLYSYIVLLVVIHSAVLAAARTVTLILGLFQVWW